MKLRSVISTNRVVFGISISFCRNNNYHKFNPSKTLQNLHVFAKLPHCHLSKPNNYKYLSQKPPGPPLRILWDIIATSHLNVGGVKLCTQKLKL